MIVTRIVNDFIMKKAIPVVGQEYNCFDDGKVRESRLYPVTVKEVVPFKEIDSDTLAQWKGEINQCDWLYTKETDFFIKTDNGSDTETFVRTKDGGWFSMGFMCSGRLDIDGTLYEYMQSNTY